MIPRWLVDVLDRELPDVVGAKRDELAEKILDALPIESIRDAISEAAKTQLRRHGVRDFEDVIANDLGANAAMSVAGALWGVLEEEEPTEGRTIQ